MSDNPWFNSPYYHLLYDYRNQQEAAVFIGHVLQLLNLPPRPATLDMACGAGRHARILASHGHRVTGIDTAENSIVEAQKGASSLEFFFVHDMRNLLSANRFDLVVNLFTSIGYAESDYDDLKIFRNAFIALKKNGIFLLDYFNRDFILKNMQMHGKKAAGGVLFIWNKTIQNNRIIKEITVDDGGRIFRFKESVCLYSCEDLQRMLKRCGFSIRQVLGDYLCTPYKTDISERTIIIAEKHVD